MEKHMNINISTGTILRVFLAILGLVGFFYISDILITILVAVVLASSVEPAIKFFGKYKIPRGLAVLILFLIITLSITLVAFLFIPPIADDVARFIKTIPTLLKSISIFGNDIGFQNLAEMISQFSKDISGGQILTFVKNTFFGSGSFFSTTSLVFYSIFHVVLIFVLSFYLAAEERGVQKFLKILAPLKDEKYIEDLWARSQKKISSWGQGQLILSLVVSVLVYIPMVILGVPYASLLAIFAFIGEFIPIVGLTLATIPALLLAWVHGGVSLLIIVSGVYFVVSQLENHVLYPNIMNRFVGVPSIIVIIALVIGAKLAGFWGILLAVPVSAVIMELINDYEKRKEGYVS